MIKVKISVPTIKNDNSGYNQLLRLASQVFANPLQHFDFDFSQCSKIEHNGVVLLGGLARYIDFHNHKTGKNKVTNLINSNVVEPIKSAGAMFLVTSMSSTVKDTL